MLRVDFSGYPTRGEEVQGHAFCLPDESLGLHNLYSKVERKMSKSECLVSKICRSKRTMKS